MTADVAARDGGGQGRPSVVFVLGGLTMGGVESQVTSLLEAGRHAWSAWDVTVLTLTRDRDAGLERRLGRAGVRVACVDRSTSSFTRWFARLVAWFRRERPDVVHTMLGGSTGTWGRLAARVAGAPRVVHSDRSLAPIRTAWQRRLEPLAHRWTDRIFTNAEAVAGRLRGEGVPGDRIRIVPNGVDLDRFAAADGRAARDAWGVGESATVVGFLGMLRPEKRPGLLLDAVATLAVQDRPDRVVLAGDGRLMQELRARVDADPWLRSHVRLLGLVEDTASFLAAIDVLASTSDTEGLPNAVIEAMAAGVPIVATRVSDVPELVTDNGLVVPPGDAAAIGAALARVLAMLACERRAMGERGRVRARAAFGLDVAARRFEAEHTAVLNEVQRRWRW